MPPTTREFAVDKAAMTVTHIPSGIVFRFEPHPDGGWIGAPTDASIHGALGLTSQILAGMASRAGDAWAAANSK